MEVLVLDVLYPTGEGLTDYDQLSDLVREGRADAEQVRLLEALQAIERSVAEENDLRYGLEQYGAETVAGVDLGRLYILLEGIAGGGGDYAVGAQ